MAGPAVPPTTTLSYTLQIWYAALYRECRAGAQIIFPESGHGLGHVTLEFLAVRPAILATAWLLVLFCWLGILCCCCYCFVVV